MNFASIFGKPWFKSMTAWGLVGYGGIGSAQAMGLIPQGTAETVSGAMSSATEAMGSLADALQGLSAGLIALGIRRAAN